MDYYNKLVMMGDFKDHNPHRKLNTCEGDDYSRLT